MLFSRPVPGYPPAMRGSSRLLLCLLLPALAGCADALAQGETNAAAANVIVADDTNAMADAMAVTNASMDDNAVDDPPYPGSNAAAGDIVEGQVLQVTGFGLGVGAMGLHLAQHYDFGAPQNLVMAMALNMRGRPSRVGRDELCRLGPVDWAEFGNIRLNFQQGRLVGWRAVPGPGRPVTDEDAFGLGSARRDITEYDGDTARVMRTPRGYAFESSGYHGMLSSGRADARVTDLWAGMICEPR